MLGVVFTGGLGPDKREVEAYLQRAAYIVAADSGLLLAEQMQVVPSMIVGDMDSIPDLKLLEKFQQAEVQRYPIEKDYTDTELALNSLRSKGCTELILIGGGGGRLDHLLGIVSLFYRKEPPSRWITHSEEVICIEHSLEIRGRAGQIVTFMPVCTEECRMITEGLKWPLDSLKWNPGDIGISNVILSDLARVTLRQGRLILIIPKTELCR